MEVLARSLWANELGLRGRLLRMVCAPLSWGWSAAAAMAGRRQAAGATGVAGLEVISVGNLAVGGTGKTPLVTWIVSTLQASGAAPAVLVGGHAADEALLLSRRSPDVPLAAGRDRVAAARAVLAQGATVAVLDDGFQHRRLHRDLDVVLLATEDVFPGPALPCGPYREGIGALARADVVLVTRRVGQVEESRSLAARVARHAPCGVLGGIWFAGAGWTDLEGRPVDAPRGDVLAACAIARPGAFRSVVAREVTGRVELVAFADHHEYTPADVARLLARAAGRPIAITEKDAVKLVAYSRELASVRVLTEAVRWDWGEEAFAARIRVTAAAGVSS
jgi:tetraacyldisaccharide 4'-kinase